MLGSVGLSISPAALNSLQVNEFLFDLWYIDKNEFNFRMDDDKNVLWQCYTYFIIIHALAKVIDRRLARV